MTPTQHLRTYANLPSEVPETLLATHIAGAEAEVKRLASVGVAPVGLETVWQDAITVKALISVLPWLNTFALDGAAKVGRLEGTVEFRFLTPDDVAARITALNTRFNELLAALYAANQPNASQSVTTTSFSLDAV